MTREEALIQLRLGPGINEDVSEEYNEAVDIAIKAIRTIPSENEKIIRISKGTLKARTGKYVIYDVEWLKTHFNTTEAKIYGQPSEDCISREAVLDSLRSWFVEGFNEDRWWNSTHVLDAINKAPSATPQPKTEPQQKTGHWEWVQYESKPNFGNWHCSECRCILRGAINGNPIRLPKYCPECGAKMQEEKK